MRTIEPINFERFGLPTPPLLLQRRLIRWALSNHVRTAVRSVATGARHRFGRLTLRWQANSRVGARARAVVHAPGGALGRSPTRLKSPGKHLCRMRPRAGGGHVESRINSVVGQVCGGRKLAVLGSYSATPAACGERRGVPVARVAGVARAANCGSKKSDIAGGVNLDAADAVAAKWSVFEPMAILT